MTSELPLATIHDAVLSSPKGRTDVALFGAQAVNAYVEPPRMTQDVDLFALSARSVAEELRAALAERFSIAVRVREVAGGRGFRVDQVRRPGDRQLVDLRQVDSLPPTREMQGFLVVTPEELIAEKVLAYHRRRSHPKAGSDWRDLALLLMAFPELKTPGGAVRERLLIASAEPGTLETWLNLVAQEFEADEDEDW